MTAIVNHGRRRTDWSLPSGTRTNTRRSYYGVRVVRESTACTGATLAREQVLDRAEHEALALEHVLAGERGRHDADRVVAATAGDLDLRVGQLADDRGANSFLDGTHEVGRMIGHGSRYHRTAYDGGMSEGPKTGERTIQVAITGEEQVGADRPEPPATL